MLSLWKNILPDLLPIIGRYAGSILRRENIPGGRRWAHMEQNFIDVPESKIVIYNYLEIGFDRTRNKFLRNIRVKHEKLTMVRDGLNVAVTKEVYDSQNFSRLTRYPDFCLRKRDWKPRLATRTNVIRYCLNLKRALQEKIVYEDENLSHRDRKIMDGLCTTKTNEFEIYALEQALKNVIHRYENDFYNFICERTHDY